MTDMVATQCPVCSSDLNDDQLYQANFSREQINARIFTPRRLPDKLHYRMVLCRQCGLMRANPVLDNKLVDAFYTASHQRDHELDRHAAVTYMRYFRRCHAALFARSRVLEVGCGSGLFLQELMDNHFDDICGVEPSLEAVAQAGKAKGLIKNTVFGPDLFQKEAFDCICAFQVFDHLNDPRQFLYDCRQYLRSQGELFIVTHDIDAWTAQLLGRHCPMVDIAHPFLYNKKTITTLLEANGFKVQKSFRINNCYPLKYWVHLLPLPAIVKKPLLSYMYNARVGNVLVTLNAGNMGLIARKNIE